jgi:L-alanine-DL-glutamate epimerase-like enolase superfamily enzyme
MKTKILDAQVEFFEQPFLRPLQISSGKITEITEARTTVRISVEGKEAVGRGSIYLSDLWAWPDPALTHDSRDAALRDLCRRIAGDLRNLCGGEPEHPLELGMRLHDSVCHRMETQVVTILAKAMCASPFDAAIHDAVGIALGRSAFDFYGEQTGFPSVDRYFSGGACEAIGRIIRQPKKQFDAWMIVSKGDSLQDDVAPWIRNRGYRCFKVKLLGKDNEADAARTVEVYRAVLELGARNPRITVDTNEANPDAASVLDYLERLRDLDAGTFEALEYLEQPTGRDILRHRNDWRGVTRLKPVLLDEGLTSLDILEEAAAQGWSGLALKTCKGHSFALTAAAWAMENGMLLALQDLTNPGYSMIHAALFAAYIPTINGVELNSPQYTPAANAEWLPRLAGLFEPMDGIHRLDTIPAGLGSTL